MADQNRNRQDAYRQQYDRDEDYARQQRNDEQEPNYTTSENRGYREGGRDTGTRTGEGGWQSRYERQMDSSREGDFANKPYGRHREGDYGYGTGQTGLTSGYADFGGDYSRGSSRNLYDRGNQGIGRRDYENRENRLGGANYDRYGDRGKYDQDQNFGQGGFASGSTYGRSAPGRSSYEKSDYGYGGYDYGRRDYGRGDYRSRDYGNRDYGRGERDERSWWDRTTDEVSSWFGDEDAERRRERDRNFRGKGPKNYSRSDDRIKEDINDRLSDDPFVDASDIEVSVSNGEVSLSGSVDHRSTKRRAEDLAEAVSGVKNVENRLRVGQYTGSQSTGTSGVSSPESSTSSSPVPGSERGRARETSQTNK